MEIGTAQGLERVFPCDFIQIAAWCLVENMFMQRTALVAAPGTYQVPRAQTADQGALQAGQLSMKWFPGLEVERAVI